MTRAEAAAIRAAHAGIPLATAGEVGYTMGSTQWMGLGGHWFYQGMAAHPAYCEGRNVRLIAEREPRMSREEFGRLWRGVVRDMLKAGALCVRVKVVGG